MEHQLKCLEIREELGDESGVAQVLEEIGKLRVSQKKYLEALKDFETAMDIFERLGSLEVDVLQYYIDSCKEKV